MVIKCLWPLSARHLAYRKTRCKVKCTCESFTPTPHEYPVNTLVTILNLHFRVECVLNRLGRDAFTRTFYKDQNSPFVLPLVVILLFSSEWMSFMQRFSERASSRTPLMLNKCLNGISVSESLREILLYTRHCPLCFHPEMNFQNAFARFYESECVSDIDN